jgi:hypothetical protein
VSDKDTIAALQRNLAAAEVERLRLVAEVERLRDALALAEVEVALERSWCRVCRTEGRGEHRGRAEHPHERGCVLCRATPLVTEDK